MNFTSSDIEHIKSRGLSVGQVQKQIECLNKPAPHLEINRPAAVGDGIVSLSKENLKPYLDIHAEAASNGRLLKFVPASGAGTRMFADAIACYHEIKANPGLISDPSAQNVSPSVKSTAAMLESIQKLPFYDDLKTALWRSGRDLDGLIGKRAFKEVLEFLLYAKDAKGLNYANKPKALMKFHRYKDRARTPLEEHLFEAKACAEDRNKVSRVHFTVSEDELEKMEGFTNDLGKVLGEELDTHFEIGFSVQKRILETVILDSEGNFFRTQDGAPAFRPAGHGALLENLNDLEADIVFIKNIDNVCCERFKADTILYKKALCGYLIFLQRETSTFLEALKQGKSEESFLSKAVEFLTKRLGVHLAPAFFQKTPGEKACLLFAKFNRPLRVCGMVKNVGEPGGAPYWVEGPDGEVTLQIVESAQIDHDAADQEAKFRSSTHFNPVVLVLGVRDYKGVPFNLLNFRDAGAYFITDKTKDGRKVKQLELPGLWNGGMAHWNTVFVEVPISTFNPVKTVYDLLRAAHQCG
ncbi:MAG: DUF4301 family protein [Candidatus Omnitrophica bacterium]|nr:DUF4301 family protein [Candidatus Omnitrophota bacterium]